LQNAKNDFYNVAVIILNDKAICVELENGKVIVKKEEEKEKKKYCNLFYKLKDE
jgi:hypothetical protein